MQKQLQEPLASVIPAAHTEFTSLMALKQGVHICSKSHAKYNFQPASNEKIIAKKDMGLVLFFVNCARHLGKTLLVLGKGPDKIMQ